MLLLVDVVSVDLSGGDAGGWLVLGANVNKTTCSNDHTVLSLACTNGHLDVVRFLLRSGADVGHKLKVANGSVMSMCCSA